MTKLISLSLVLLGIVAQPLEPLASTSIIPALNVVGVDRVDIEGVGATPDRVMVASIGVDRV